eukprot:scaffold774_cov248-Pinguiococcus_pyrenoidosus.AAC.2
MAHLGRPVVAGEEQLPDVVRVMHRVRRQRQHGCGHEALDARDAHRPGEEDGESIPLIVPVLEPQTNKMLPRHRHSSRCTEYNRPQCGSPQPEAHWHFANFRRGFRLGRELRGATRRPRKAILLGLGAGATKAVG